MERSIKKNGLINFLVLLAVGLAAFATARYTNTLAGQVSLQFLLIGVVLTGVSWFQMRLEENERIEKLEFDEMAKSKATSALFETKDAELFPVQRSRRQFEKFLVPAFTILFFLWQVNGAFLFWRWLSKPSTFVALRQPTTALALFALFALLLFLLGKFSSTIARLENHRLLRPGANYLLLGAYLCFFVTLGLVAVQAGYLKADLYVARAFCVLLALVGVETLVNLLFELYRPRVKGKVGRPLYDSRLVGILGQPEGLITTAAQALDYQFGFKVSDTWFYRLFEKSLKWLVLAQFSVLVLSTCFVFIDAGEQGLLEHFGQPVASRSPLNPGAHLKWPWPIDQVYRFRTEQIQSFELGVPAEAQKEEAKEKETVVLWTVAHTKQQEDNFLVANREQTSTEDTNQPASKRTPPVSLITGSIPVQFQITNLTNWAYKNEDAPSLLEDVARREVVRYFVGADMGDIMSRGRLDASRELRTRIQAAADSHQLGARIVSVGLQDMHPPVKVAADYEKVVAGIHTKQAKILAARADEIKTNALAGAQSVRIVNTARADGLAREIGALAQAGLFANQLPAFQAAPAVYVERAYLESFARATANARKYIILTTNTDDVIQYDLQESVAQDLLNVNVPAPKK